jgi:hypothetical protein
VSNLVKHHGNTMVRVEDDFGTDLVARPDGSLVPPTPPAPPADPATTRSRGPSRLAVAVIAAALLAAVAVGAAAFSGGSSARGSDAGTGGTAPSGAAHGSLAASAAASASTSSVSYQVSATETTPSSTTTLLEGHGSADLSTGVGRLTATIPGLSSLLGSGATGAVDVISDGTNVYLKIPGVSSLTGGKSWVETPLSDLGSLTGSSAGSLSLSTLTDPGRALTMLGSLGSPVTDLGTVTLGGQRVTEYQTTITVADIASHLPGGSGSSAARALQHSGIPSIPVTAWVGRDGLLCQLSLTVDASHASLSGLLGSLDPGSSTPTSAGAKVNLTIGLSRYGAPVAVGVPPAAQVTDLGSIASSLKGMVNQLGGTLSGIASHI